jgi:hypothetical protein
MFWILNQYYIKHYRVLQILEIILLIYSIIGRYRSNRDNAKYYLCLNIYNYLSLNINKYIGEYFDISDFTLEEDNKMDINISGKFTHIYNKYIHERNKFAISIFKKYNIEFNESLLAKFENHEFIPVYEYTGLLQPFDVEMCEILKSNNNYLRELYGIDK